MDAVEILDFYVQNPLLKSQAQDSKSLQLLFAAAFRVAVVPTLGRKGTKRNGAVQDRCLLDKTQIRTNRAKAFQPGPSSYGSLALPPPPIISTVDLLNQYAITPLGTNKVAFEHHKSLDMHHEAMFPGHREPLVAAREQEPQKKVSNLLHTQHEQKTNKKHDTLQINSNQPETEHRVFAKLSKPRACNICHSKFRDLHFFYDQLCPKCATFNYNKRSFSVKMVGRVCIVTGARVKVRKKLLLYKRKHAQSRKLGAFGLDFLALV